MRILPVCVYLKDLQDEEGLEDRACMLWCMICLR